MNLPQTGGCQCGKVRYEITQQPLLVYTCHCLDCQRLTGSAFSLGVVVPKVDSGSPASNRARTSGSPRAAGSARDWSARNAGPGSLVCPGMAYTGSVGVRSTIRRGCGRPGISGARGGSRGS